jgi:hypothetical protein
VKLDANAILLSMLIGTVGFGFFLYGKKQRRIPQIVGGIAMMVYPYFIPDLILMGGIALVVLAGMWLAVRMGL